MASTGYTLVGTSYTYSASSPAGSSWWTSYGNITSLYGDAYCYFAAYGGTKYSHYLSGSNLGFAVPTGSTIDGIEVQYNSRMTSGGSGRRYIVYLNKTAGTPVGTNQDTNTWLTATATTYTIGSSSNLWGTTWTASEVNDAGFGALQQVEGLNDTGAYFIYTTWMKLQVHYTPPAPRSQAIVIG